MPRSKNTFLFWCARREHGASNRRAMEAPIENLLVLAQGGRQHSPLSLSSLKGKAVVLHFFTS